MIIHNIPLFEKRFDLPSSVWELIPSYAALLDGAHFESSWTDFVASQNRVLGRIEEQASVYVEERLSAWWPLHLIPSSAPSKSLFEHAFSSEADDI